MRTSYRDITLLACCLCLLLGNNSGLTAMSGLAGYALVANDFLIFTMMGLSSFSAAALVNAAGWQKMNAGSLPVVLVVAAAVAWLAWRRRAAPAD